MTTFQPRSFYGNSSRDAVESDDNFSEEDNYIPPSDDEETSSADLSESGDEDETSAQDNRGAAQPQALSWSLYTNNLPDFPVLTFSASNPGSQIGPSNLQSELQFFQLFFTDQLIGEIVHETNRYACEKISSAEPLAKHSIWKSWEDVAVDEFKAFLAVLMNMVLNPKPDIKEYFSKEILEMPFFRLVFTRTRFLQIFWMLHVSPPPQGPSGQPTRGSKVRNVVSYTDPKCREHFKPGPKICVDESTVGFKGRVSFKCYNPQKPTKWGLRVYILADCAIGYVSAFEPYYGSTTTESLPRPDLPFTCRIVLHLLDKVQCASPGRGYHLYTDRFYTSPTLADELLSQDIKLTGTVMTNRKNMPQHLKKKMKKGDVVAYRQGNSFMTLAWQDKRQVTMLSSAHNPSMKAVTRTQAHGQTVTLQKPVVICDYTENMGAVDRADHY
ncbi:piggyBac transposable element-derived protein 4-like [Ixodes scapularis]|uniref:piggyBac transposable element-derived protein 4-like n=1 Tax=Ixodes scapularis TaxID=6945 RepID=UPI001A9FD92B|nr:piggyBac transposable element-derived protein 4-like [Ixodes scapularis]